jgi:hypothetical protein
MLVLDISSGGTMFKFLWDCFLAVTIYAWVPLVASALFCLATGMPFLVFWAAVFNVMAQYIGWLVSLCNLQTLHEIQHWFRFMIF